MVWLRVMALRFSLPILLILIPATVTVGREREWTTLRGRIVLDGDVPERSQLDITRDEEFCGPFQLTDDSLVVHPENHGVKNVAIWLRSKRDVPVHPSYAADFGEPAVLDNHQCRFSPRLLRIRTGQTFQATSTDEVRHNVAVYGRRNDPFSEIVPPDAPLERTFPQAETQPIRVDCSIHAWMRAYLLITDHPYAAVTDENGRFELPHVPQGTWTFRFWHERPGYLPEIVHDGMRRELRAGAWEINVTDETLDLGDLIVTSESFNED